VVVGKQGPTCESIAECPQVEGVPVARVATVRVAAVVSRCLCESASPSRLRAALSGQRGAVAKAVQEPYSRMSDRRMTL
jgi:hypothetical protein